MVYNIYAFSKPGMSITMDLLKGLGYAIEQKSSINIAEGRVATFKVDVQTKSCVFSTEREPNYLMLNRRMAFRATTFITKYQNDAREVIQD